MAQKISMAGGDGKHGYSKNSTPQRKAMQTVVFQILDKALQQVAMPQVGEPIVVADLGCSSGTNSIDLVSRVVQVLRSRCLESGEVSKTPRAREFQMHFNDLQWNDFNTFFKHLCEEEADRSNCYATGVPGSFFGRLFPRSSVHVFVSTMALHYLSKIPSSLTDETSPAFNKGNWWLDGASDATAKAYKDQFIQDWNSLLRARSEELVPGGLLCFMIKTRPAQKANALRAEDDSVDALEICLREAAEEMVANGMLTEQQMNSLNVPMYYPLFHEELLQIVKSFDSDFEILAAAEISVPFYLLPVSSFGKETFDPTCLSETVTGFSRGILGGSIFGQVMGNEEQDLYWQHFSEIAKKYTSALGRGSLLRLHCNAQKMMCVLYNFTNRSKSWCGFCS